ncbi:MAG TPA: hypothetical protein GX519_07170, partial [Thermoanaerobacterales bacterium]|nr:hypothetical protein [Thermoanaerobacterales bacterium]
MDVYAIPIVNGVLPRPDGGVLQGIFLDPFFANMLLSAGVGNNILLFPLSSDDQGPYPVGVLARIEDLWVDKTSQGGGTKALFARVIGRERYKARSFSLANEGLFALDLERVDI